MKVRDNSDGRTALRSLGGIQTQLSKTLEKLASGYAINRAADDAAGLAISEKMRWLITGTGRAEANSREGIQLIQIGEGALAEIHDMLNRATTLAGNSANGTYVDEVDREALQRELDQLCSEIDRIAQSTSYNSVKLFQDKGYEYESSVYTLPTQPTAQGSSGTKSLDDLLEGQEKGSLNIVYVEKTYAVDATQTPQDTAAAQTNIVIDGKNLNDILKDEIIPNTVNNILTNYPAFSYLTGSSIGIGLEYFSQGSSGGSTTLASVSSQPIAEGGTVTALTYKLRVNTSVLSDAKSRSDLAALEATIAHEMIHAFMFEASSAGMFGYVYNDAGVPTATTDFPDWFIEGMAQTASGPGNWLSATGGLHISSSSTVDEINAAIKSHPLGSTGGAGDYGTGYLACMYLGAVIAAGGTPSPTVDASTISLGLSKLLNEVIGGKSLNDAIKELTNRKFSGLSNFQSQFNSGSQEIGTFVQNLLTATGSGRGGIVSGDLTATDLTSDTPLTGVKLFELNPGTSTVVNRYPDGYPIFTGGAANVSGTAPSDFTPREPTAEYGDFIVTGALPSDVEYDDSTGTLTVTGGSNVKISMKNPGTSSPGKIVVDGAAKVTLSGVELIAPDALTVNNSAEIAYEGKNSFGGIALAANVNVVFNGSGQLKTDTFSSGSTNDITFRGGGVIVDNGTGSIAGTVHIDKAAIAAVLTSPDTTIDQTGFIGFDWADQLQGLGNIASIRFDGVQSDILLDQNQPNARLWLDPNATHRITFTDSNGVSKTLVARMDNNGTMVWAEPVKPFQITGGTEGTDYHYEDDGTTLVIDTDTSLTISGGTTIDENGNDLFGRIKLADGVGTVDLILDDCDVKAANGCAFDLGNGNTVTLTLTNGKTSSFTSGSGYAGIHVGDGTSLTINGSNPTDPNDPSTGSILNATGGTTGAGIGSNGTGGAADPGSKIVINSGTINASGGTGTSGGAGIGAGTHSAFGDIEINGGIITSNGGMGGAGIGGAGDDRSAPCGDVGNITITGGTIQAHSAGHGAGIGGGWGLGTREPTAHSGDIYISGGDIWASSTTHGTGIGAGCLAIGGDIIINGSAHIHEAIGGDGGAGIGGSSSGKCGNIDISGNATIDLAQGGRNGAGIGSGNSSSSGTIMIDTTGSVTAKGGTNGVGIGSGYGNSSSGDISIKQGTVNASGQTDATGIGAGRGSSSGNITIGDPDDPNSKVIVTATGGMTNNGGNIMSYTDNGHNNPGTLTVVGNNTSVRPGAAGEGLYSTSGAVDENGKDLYSYPVYLFESDPPLSAGDGLVGLPLPDGATDIQISAVGADGTQKTWAPRLSHSPLDDEYVFVWMTGQDQKLQINYTAPDGTPGIVVLDLIFHADSGTFRVGTQPTPPPAEKPGYTTDPTPPNPPTPGTPGTPSTPGKTPTYEGKGGIILQIGANYGETLEIPCFYLSARALGLWQLDISTQDNALAAMPIIKEAVNRVSSIRGTYGALSNRLEHNRNNLNQSVENLSDAESRIRDADMAKEYMDYVSLTIKNQAAQAMLSQSNQNLNLVLSLLQ